jgi:hypothetical protein
VQDFQPVVGQILDGESKGFSTASELLTDGHPLRQTLEFPVTVSGRVDRTSLERGDVPWRNERSFERVDDIADGEKETRLDAKVVEDVDQRLERGNDDFDLLCD